MNNYTSHSSQILQRLRGIDACGVERRCWEALRSFLLPDPELYTNQSIRETFTLVRTELNSVFNVVVETDRGRWRASDPKEKKGGQV